MIPSRIPAEMLRKALLAMVGLMLMSASALAATPAFSVHKNGTAQTVVVDTPTKLTWSTEVIDTNTNFATDQFTPTVAGNYLIVASVQCAQPGACVPAIYKNGALYAASRQTNQTFADQSPQVSAIISMNGSTDYVEAFATSSGSSIGGVATQTYFSGSQIDGGGAGGGGGGTRAHARFNGTTAAVIHSSNVSGITRNSAGRYTLTFTTALPNTNYVVLATAENPSSDARILNETTNRTMTSFVVQFQNTSGTAVDPDFVDIAILGEATAGSGSSQWSDGSAGAIYYNAGNVGIGTTTPGAKLSIKEAGTGHINMGQLSGNTLYRALGFSQTSGAVTAANYSMVGEGSNTLINRSTGGIIEFRESNVGQMTIAAGGNVGIGTASPDTKLEVAGTISATIIVAAPPMMILADEKASGTAGGTCTAGSWMTRTLNTARENSITGGSLASNEVTLPAGKYLVRARSPGLGNNRFQARLFNVTDGTAIAYGTSEYGSSTAPLTQQESWVITTFTIAAQKVIRIEHRCQVTQGTNGFGIEANLGGTEVYATLEITKFQ